jgi:hypothetical protein
MAAAQVGAPDAAGIYKGRTSSVSAIRGCEMKVAGLGTTVIAKDCHRQGARYRPGERLSGLEADH